MSLRRGRPPRRITRLRAQSPRAVERNDARREALDVVRRRSGNRCEVGLYGLVPEVRCSGPLDGDELLSRGRGGDETDPEHIAHTCRAHHDWKHAEGDEAVARGVARRSWQGPRCSAEWPCPQPNLLHIAMWGDCVSVNA